MYPATDDLVVAVAILMAEGIKNLKAILSAPGSRGDVNPMIAIGRRLKTLGHQVVISVAAPYADLARQAGLEVEAVISDASFDRAVGNADVWRPVHGPLQIFRVMIRDFLAKHREVIERHLVPKQTVLVAHPLDLVSRIFREADERLPLVGVHLQPVILRTLHEPPRLSPWWFEPRRPSWLIGACYSGIDHLVIDPLLRRHVNALRKEFGLNQPIRRVMDRWWLSPDTTMALYPRLFAPATENFCPALQYCGFPLDDVSGDDFSPPSDCPIVFTSGTANRHCGIFFRRAVEACLGLNRRGVLLSSYPENFPSDLPASIECHPYLSLGQLLPHCAAIVHHGGIGTTSQAFAAGIPQVIRPLAFDQFDNAERVERLGCGAWLKRDRDLTHVIDRILDLGGKVSKTASVMPPGSIVSPSSLSEMQCSLSEMQASVSGVRGAVVAADKIHEYCVERLGRV